MTEAAVSRDLYPDARDRYSSDNNYNRFACRSYNYDPRYCR